MTFLTIKETAGLLKVSKRTVRRYIAAGLLPVSRITHKTVRIKEDDVKALAQGVECQSN